MKTSTYLNKTELLERWQQSVVISRTTWLIGFVLVLVAGLANPVLAQTRFTNDFVIISGTRGGSPITTTQYATKTESATSSKSFDGQDLGEGAPFNRDQNGIDALYINAEANTFTNSGDNIQSTQLLYRVYRTDTPPTDIGSQIPQNLTLQSSTPGGLGKWSYLTNQTNLINFATTPGEYTVEVAFEGAYTSSASPNTTIRFRDDNGGNFYKAKFTQVVYNQPYVALKWTPVSGSTNWFDEKNWTNANPNDPTGNSVPNSNTDVSIPYGGTSYPTINTSGASALVHNLTIAGNSTQKQITNRLSLNQGSLNIYGDFQDLNGGFNQSAFGFLYLKGQAQTFDASTKITFRNLTITGGGTKTITKVLNISSFLSFAANADGSAAGILATGNVNADDYSVKLQANASLVGETEGAYVLGTVYTFRPLIPNQTNTFGSIGLDLYTTASVGNVTVVRTSSIYQGTGTSVSIRRGFILTPDNVARVTADLTFHYLTEDLNGIAPQNLRLFSSETGDIPFVALNQTSASQTDKTVTLNGFNGTLVNTFTLGDAANPLPVTLVSFTATPTAQGAALLRWATATESNNRGFGIERQLGANEAWQSVGFAAAKATTGSTYEFTDKSLVNAPASAQAYYRLRQEDLNGKVTYSPVAAINRTAAVATTELTLSPVPVGGTDNLSVGLAEAGQAGIMVAVINTQGQRLMSFTTQASTDGALSLPVTSLAAGVYIVTVQVPGQAVRHARFVKL